MPAPARKGFWPRLRRVVRWIRITLLALLLFALSGLIYLNRVGLPELLRARLIAELHARGVDFEFSRMRLHWYRGLVAENLNLGRAAQPLGPQLYIDTMELRLNPAALRKFEFKVDSLLIHRARLVWPLVVTNQPVRRISLDDLTTELRFLPNDQWELDRFQARCLGARVQLVGTLTNASQLRSWLVPRATNAVTAARVDRWIEWVDAMDKVRFRAPPDIRITLQGDARDPASFNARLMVDAKGVVTPEGAVRNLLLTARLNQPPATNGEMHSELRLKLDSLRTPWLRARDGRLDIDLVARPDRDGLLRSDWGLRVEQVRTRWGSTRALFAAGHTRRSATNDLMLDTDVELRADQWQTGWGTATNNHFTARLQNQRRDFVPVAADGRLRMHQIQTRWGTADTLRVTTRLARAPTNAPVRADASWAEWAALEPFQVDWAGQVDRFTSSRLSVRNVTATGHWRAPDLTLGQLHADLYGGQLEAQGRLEVATRAATAEIRSDFDPRPLVALLPAGAERWLDQVTWQTPPKLEAQARARLPAWTDRQPDWRGEVLPTLTVAGRFTGGNAAVRGVSVSSATAHFTVTNLVWAVPDLVIARPEGRGEFDGRGNLSTHEYHGRVNCHLDPGALLPVLNRSAQRGLTLFQFTDPPWIQGEVWGRSDALERIGFVARVAATNFVFRHETGSAFSATVQYTNRFFTFTDARVRHDDQNIFAPGVGFDLASERVYLTNAVSTMDPMIIARAIGPNTARALAPYHFDRPPDGRVNGSVHVRSPEQPDLRFELAGGPFHYWKFNLPQVTGTVLWRGDWLTLTNLEGSFYGGRLRGDAGFDFSAPREADFHLHANASDADLKALMADVSSPTHKLEGAINGTLDVTAANTADWDSWNGSGILTLRDGYLWDFPLFGIFSPILNKVVPGLGRTRFKEGAASFTITNSIIHTENLTIRSPALRLHYRGTVDFQGRVNARAEASVLRDTWLVGQLFSLALTPLSKIFEYKVTGTLEDPKTDPLYIPKVLLMPLHPFRTLKDLLSNPPSTNVPPAP